MGATDLKTRMQKYCGEAREWGYTAMYFHAMIDGRNGGGQRLKSQLKGKVMAKLIQAYCQRLEEVTKTARVAMHA